jgi:hypothetical protein
MTSAPELEGIPRRELELTRAGFADADGDHAVLLLCAGNPESAGPDSNLLQNFAVECRREAPDDLNALFIYRAVADYMLPGDLIGSKALDGWRFTNDAVKCHRSCGDPPAETIVRVLLSIISPSKFRAGVGTYCVSFLVDIVDLPFRLQTEGAPRLGGVSSEVNDETARVRIELPTNRWLRPPSRT